MRNKRVLLLGNIKEDSSRSMKIYLNYLKRILPSVNVFEPSCGKVPVKVYKNFIYPFIIPKGYDIYHIIDHSYGHLAKFLPKEKTIITCHDLIPLHFKERLSFLGRIAFRYYISGLKRTKKIISISESTKNDLTKILKIPQKKIETIHTLEVDTNKFKRLDKKNLLKKYPQFADKKILLNVGSLFYKNSILILKSLKKIKKKISNIFFLKIGNFTNEELDYIEKNNLKKLIMQKKEVSEKELVEIYNLSDVLVFPSLYEGFGIPPLEAMACEIPVISSNASSLPEVVGDAAIEIDPSSVKELKDSIIEIMKNKKLRASLIKNGRKNLKRFSSKKQAKQLNKIYQEIYNQNVRNKRF